MSTGRAHLELHRYGRTYNPEEFVMKSNLKKRWYGVIAAVSIAVGLMAGSVSRVYAKNPNPGVIPPHAKAYGMTYGEWSAKW